MAGAALGQELRRLAGRRLRAGELALVVQQREVFEVAGPAWPAARPWQAAARGRDRAISDTDRAHRRTGTASMGQQPLATGTALPGSYVNPAGEFVRDQRYITSRITADGRGGFPVEPGRYRLVVSRACPWANRAIIVRRLLGLEDVLSMGITGPVHDARSWTFDLDSDGRDPVLGIERLAEAYF